MGSAQLFVFLSYNHSHRSHMTVSGPPCMYSNRVGLKRNAVIHFSNSSIGIVLFSNPFLVVCITSVVRLLLIIAIRPCDTSVLASGLDVMSLMRHDATILVLVNIGTKWTTSTSGIFSQYPSPRHCSADCPGKNLPS